MPIGIELQNSENWTLFYEDDIIAQPATTGEGHFAIQDFSVPITTDKDTLAIYVTTPNPKPRWYWGGTVLATVNTGLPGGNASGVVVHKMGLSLGNTNLLRLPSVADSYGLRFVVPYWFKAFSYSIWEYTGTGQGSVEGKLDAIQVSIEAL